LLGLLLAVLGAILLWGYAAYIEGMANITGSAAGILIGFGVLLIIVSCIGCFGVCLGHKICLIIYMVCVALLLIGQLIVVIIHLMKKSVRTTMDRQVEVYTGERNSNFETITLNLLQTLVGCCGVNNGSDFNFSKDWNRTFTITDTRMTTRPVLHLFERLSSMLLAASSRVWSCYSSWELCWSYCAKRQADDGRNPDSQYKMNQICVTLLTAVEVRHVS
uniref:Tetraspanin n=1 Tax=Macrostomum lignano TaxID=282301 RepID=A0A1I8F9B4_9PLAT